MTDRPIVFSTPMVQALLREIAKRGTGKTQTRRMIQPQPELLDTPPMGGWHVYNRHGGAYSVPEPEIAQYLKDYLTPAWERGDRAWVREGLKRGEADGYAVTDYSADDTNVTHSGWQWKPKVLAGRYMPRWANRITLHVTDVRVMRLQDTSEADAVAEGAMFHDGMGIGHSGWRHDFKDVHANARSSYARLMDHLHGAGFWDSNPWVYALTFVPELAHIDNARREP